MKVFVQIAAACLLVQVAFAAKGPIPEPVCDVKCPDTFPIEENVHLPYTGDCTKFCHCANDGNWKKDCPPGLHFNPTLQVCDWPHAAGCVEEDPKPTTTPEPAPEPTTTASPAPEPTTTASPAPEPTTTASPAPEPTTTPAPSPKPVPNGCEDQTCGPDDCFDWANTGDCQEYCKCDHGEIILKECADGLHFNPATGNCDFPENANCEIKTPPPPPLNGCEETVCGPHDCFKGPNSLDCNLYCDCDHGEVTIGNCADGLHFNPATGTCDFPWNAGCEDKPTQSVPEGSTSGVPGTNPPATNPPATDPPHTNPPQDGTCDDICPNVWPVVENNHLYPGDCTKFCHCANDGNWLKDCPPGLHFNQELQVCDWPADAKCEVVA